MAKRGNGGVVPAPLRRFEGDNSVEEEGEGVEVAVGEFWGGVVGPSGVGIRRTGVGLPEGLPGEELMATLRGRVVGLEEEEVEEVEEVEEEEGEGEGEGEDEEEEDEGSGDDTTCELSGDAAGVICDETSLESGDGIAGVVVVGISTIRATGGLVNARRLLKGRLVAGRKEGLEGEEGRAGLTKLNLLLELVGLGRMGRLGGV